MTQPDTTIDDKLNDLRGRKLTEIQVGNLLAFAITINRYAQQPWYKKLRRFK